MSYQALLFCPDEKTARTVTQVLSDLEFTVDACSEPFAAVKKLMAERFDAIVVDCDNEQNATLLFKSARNSSSNQAALAVAVVEGQAGVAKAFRIGANLVLTKPINVDQAKGTLRVARGLLRKGDAAKPVASPAAPAAVAVPTATPIPTPTPVAAKAPSIPVLPKQITPPTGPSTLPPRPVPAQPVARAAKPPVAASVDLNELLETPADPEKPAAKPEPIVAPKVAPAANVVEPRAPKAPAAAAKTVSFSISSGAASAPALAPEPRVPVVPAQTPAEPAIELPKATSAQPAEEPYTAPAPSFTFGGAVEPASLGGGKKALIAVAAMIIVIAGGYFGWTQYKSKTNPAAQSSAATQAVTPAPVSQPAASSAAAATPQPAVDATDSPFLNPDEVSEHPANKKAEKTTEKPSEKSSKSAKTEKATPSGESDVTVTKPEQALVVKNGSVPVKKTQAAVPDAAPPMVAMSGAGGSLPNLVENSGDTPVPVLQRLNISQGVSQGLITKRVQPTYPTNALRMHIEGNVELMATIAKSGNITSIKVVSGEPMLAEAALQAVKQWKYRPYLLNGEPVEIQTQITVKFKLPN